MCRPRMHADVCRQKRGASVEATATRSVARARMGSGLAVTVLLLPFGGYGLARAGVVAEGAPVALGLLSVIASFVLLPALCEERVPFRHSSSHLTARTLTGERSVDLNQITTVRLLTTFSYGTAYRTLLVRDAHGVRLGITTERSRRKLRRAIEKAHANAAQGCPPAPREPCGPGTSGPCPRARARRPHGSRLCASDGVREPVRGRCTPTRRVVRLPRND